MTMHGTGSSRSVTSQDYHESAVSVVDMNVASLQTGNYACVVDNVGIRGYLLLRQDAPSHYRMKRYYCQIIGVTFMKYNSMDQCIRAGDFSNRVSEHEILELEEWDGRGVFHRYKNAFKIHTTSGILFNIDAESEKEKMQWIAYIRSAINAVKKATNDLESFVSSYPSIMNLSMGGIEHLNRKSRAPSFQNEKNCCHSTCTIRFDITSKRQHHCRSCGGTVCSEHSSMFTPLPHIGFPNPVRVCVSCLRVQKFLLFLRSMLQTLILKRYTDKQVTELSPEALSVIDDVTQALGDEDCGISDVLQLLHLHRRGCDEAFSLITDRLIEISYSNLEDFEFFLPQVFHMWTSFDCADGMGKQALLFRVLMIAVKHHVRLAQSIYWLARASIDDSCGLGFGQGEKPIVSCSRKFPMFKIFMINIDIMLAGASWRYAADQDLKSPDAQTEIIQILFDRLFALLELDASSNKASVDLGSFCAAMQSCSLPTPLHYRDLEKIDVQTEEITEEFRARMVNFFKGQLRFMDKLCLTADSLREISPGDRKKHLPSKLKSLLLPPLSFFPLGSVHDPIARIVNIPSGEGTVFSTRARAPTLIYFELQRSGGFDGGMWYRQFPVDVHEEMPTSIRKSSSLPHHDVLSHLVQSQMDYNRRRSATNGVDVTVLENDGEDDFAMQLTDASSAMSQDTPLEAIEEEIQAPILSTRGRCNSVNCIIDACENVSQSEMDDLPKDVERLTMEQLESIASCMKRSLMPRHARDERSERGEKALKPVYGKDAVEWMISNDIAVDPIHATWIGNEMLGAGLVYEVNYEKPFLNTEDLYVIDIPTMGTSFRKKGKANSLPAPIVALHNRFTNRLMSPHRLDMHRPSAPTPIDDDHSVVSTVALDPMSSLLETFIPRNVIALLTEVQDELSKLGGADKEKLVSITSKLETLHSEISKVCEYVDESRKLQYEAMTSAFGEFYETTIRRIQEATRFGKLEGWDCVSLIVKSHDDLRQESFCLQLIRQFQDIFDSAGLSLRLLPYRIVASSASTGFIETIRNACSLDSLKKRANYRNLSVHFKRTYGGEESTQYRTALQNYVRSMAAYSLVCYFLQVKDRHNGNIMLDSEGHIIHIDYGFILGIAPGGRFSLETAPFKLTSEMVDAMGGTESEYFKEYIVLLIQGFLALQQHADTILMMIAIMAQDSTLPCFKNKMPRGILNRVKPLFKLELDHHQVIKYVLRLVNRSHNSYRTRQYDKFQKMTNGIAP